MGVPWRIPVEGSKYTDSLSIEPEAGRLMASWKKFVHKVYKVWEKNPKTKHTRKIYNEYSWFRQIRQNDTSSIFSIPSAHLRKVARKVSTTLINMGSGRDILPSWCEVEVGKSLVAYQTSCPSALIRMTWPFSDFSRGKFDPSFKPWKNASNLAPFLSKSQANGPNLFPTSEIWKVKTNFPPTWQPFGTSDQMVSFASGSFNLSRGPNRIIRGANRFSRPLSVHHD